MIEITINGRCIPKGRPRFGRNGQVFTPKRTKDYEREVQWAAKLAMRKIVMQGNRKIVTPLEPLQGPLSCAVAIYFRMPLSWWPAKRKKALAGEIIPPFDCDNMAKNLQDSMNSIVYLDDRQIVSLSVSKRYADKDYVVVRIEPADITKKR